MYRYLICFTFAVAAATIPSRAQADEAYDSLVARMGRDLGIEGELALRIVAQGLPNAAIGSPAERRERLGSRDILCDFEVPTGQHFTNVVCREYQYHSDNAVGSGASTGRGGDLTVGVSRNLLVYRVREGQIRNAIAQLPGLPAMNDRLVAEGLAGLPLPVGLPTEEELEKFVRAYRGVNEVSRRYDPMIATASGSGLNQLRREADDAMVRAIRDAGLAADRYNEIVEHVGTHPELFEYVRNHLSSGG